MAVMILVIQAAGTEQPKGVPQKRKLEDWVYFGGGITNALLDRIQGGGGNC